MSILDEASSTPVRTILAEMIALTQGDNCFEDVMDSALRAIPKNSAMAGVIEEAVRLFVKLMTSPEEN